MNPDSWKAQRQKGQVKPSVSQVNANSLENLQLQHQLAPAADVSVASAKRLHEIGKQPPTSMRLLGLTLTINR